MLLTWNPHRAYAFPKLAWDITYTLHAKLVSSFLFSKDGDQRWPPSSSHILWIPQWWWRLHPVYGGCGVSYSLDCNHFLLSLQSMAIVVVVHLSSLFTTSSSRFQIAKNANHEYVIYLNQTQHSKLIWMSEKTIANKFGLI